MSELDVIRAWKDEEYRQSLSDDERAKLPQNPAGFIELNDMDLSSVAGGADDSWGLLTYGCCITFGTVNCGTNHGYTYGCCGGTGE